ncbi:hypothetical protein G4B84_008287 [Aspergillus flavus NRRL3357]|nr:uncharacterized protein G4B84_008287 [Aspergillus flavus NRRL3357]QMW32856.1 hypothetical protein G4B84_008287 [Aspergillus flavus NRRL3357]QMW44886.1 hypothetical protein G4B11_008306 [Aspergillus flavus]
MVFSVACFVAIVAIVRAFDGKPAPVFWRVVALNAVVPKSGDYVVFKPSTMLAVGLGFPHGARTGARLSIQQIISHETESVQIPNGSAVAKQALRIDPTCPDLFIWKLSGYNRAAQSDLQCNVTLSDGAISGVPIQIRFDADESGFVRLPKDIIWKITWFSQEQNAGINNHTMLFAHAELDVDTDMIFAHVELDSVTTPSDIVSIPEGKLKIKRVTSCAISFCARNYNISVSHGTLTEQDWGRIFFDDGGVVCWIPDRALRKASTQEAPLPKPTHGSEYSICYVVPEPRLIYDNVVSGFSGQTFWEWSVGHLGGDWIFKDAGEKSVHNDDSIPMTSRIMELRFEEVT